MISGGPVRSWKIWNCDRRTHWDVSMMPSWGAPEAAWVGGAKSHAKSSATIATPYTSLFLLQFLSWRALPQMRRRRYS